MQLVLCGTLVRCLQCFCIYKLNIHVMNCEEVMVRNDDGSDKN